MAPKYTIGQAVRIRPSNQGVSLRDSDLKTYAGQTGEVTNFYSISPLDGSVFYTYTVRLSPSHRVIVTHEDEIEAEF